MTNKQYKFNYFIEYTLSLPKLFHTKLDYLHEKSYI